MMNGRDLLRAGAASNFRGLELMARGVMEGMARGLHKSHFKGFAIEFDQHRPYVRGDDLKHLDWKLLARLDRQYIKQYEEDTSLRAWLVLDASGSMTFDHAGTSKLQTAKVLAAVMGTVLLRQQDSVGLAVCDQDLRELIAPRTGPRHLSRLMEAVAAVEGQGPTSLATALERLDARLKKRSLLIIFSDFFEDLTHVNRVLGRFAARKHEVMLCRILDPQERKFDFCGAVSFECLEGGGKCMSDALRVRRRYQREFDVHAQQLSRISRRYGINLHTFWTHLPLARQAAEFLLGRTR